MASIFGKNNIITDSREIHKICKANNGDGLWQQVVMRGKKRGEGIYWIGTDYIKDLRYEILKNENNYQCLWYVFSLSPFTPSIFSTSELRSAYPGLFSMLFHNV